MGSRWFGLMVWIGLTWTIGMADGRTVAALTDYCQRFPSAALCTGGGQPAPIVAGPAPTPAAPAPAPAPAVPAPAPATPVGGTNPTEYCAQYLAHYRWYCVGNGAGDPRANAFCPSYTQICNPAPQPVAPQPPANPANPIVSNNPVCAQYAQTAAVYCSGPTNESPQVKPSCDQYRAACANPGAIPQQPPLVNQQQAMCYQYQNQYLIVCVQSRPITPEALKFCQEFATMCLQQQAMQGRRKRWIDYL